MSSDGRLAEDLLAEKDERSRTFKKYFAISTCYISYAFVYFHRFCVPVLSGSIASDFKIPVSSVGIFSSMYFWPFGVMQSIYGALADIFEPGYLIGFANITAAVGSIICSMSHSFPLSCFGRAIVGFGCSAVFAPTNKIGIRWVSTKVFRYFSGMTLAAGGCGALLSSVPLSILGKKIGWRMSMLIAGLIEAFLSVLSFLWVRGKVPDGFEDADSKPNASVVKQLGRNLIRVAKIRNFWVLFVYMLLSPGFFLDVSSMWGLPYLKDAFGFSHDTASLIQLSLSLSIVLACPLIPIISEKLGSRKITSIVFLVLSIASILILIFAEKYLGAITVGVLMFIFGCGSLGTQGTLLGLAKDLADDSLAGTSIGMANSGPFLGCAALQTVTSHIIATYTPPLKSNAYLISLWGVGIGCLGLSIISVAFVRDPRNLENSQGIDSEMMDPLIESVG